MEAGHRGWTSGSGELTKEPLHLTVMAAAGYRRHLVTFWWRAPFFIQLLLSDRIHFLYNYWFQINFSFLTLPLIFHLFLQLFFYRKLAPLLPASYYHFSFFIFYRSFSLKFSLLFSSCLQPFNPVYPGYFGIEHNFGTSIYKSTPFWPNPANSFETRIKLNIPARFLFIRSLLN